MSLFKKIKLSLLVHRISFFVFNFILGKTPLGFKKKDKMLMQSIIVGSKKKKTHSKLIQKVNLFSQF